MNISALNEKLQGRYVFERPLGHGAAGQVYLGRSELTQQRIAIKVMRTEIPDPDDSVHDRFMREARTLGRLQHPNILPILDAGEIEGVAYYTMPFVEGESLADILRRSGSLPVETALSIASAVAAALEHAHASGVIHRDVKPANVLVPNLDYHGAKLTDFGLQGTLDARTHLTQPGQIYGTPTYMAPEQVRGLAQSAATDVFGLGVMLYETIYGKTPFTDDSVVALLHRIVNEPVRFPAAPVISADLRRFLERCLAKEPAERPKAPLVDLRRLEGAIASGRPAVPPTGAPVQPSRHTGVPRPLDEVLSRHASAAASSAAAATVEAAPGFELTAMQGLAAAASIVAAVVVFLVLRRSATLAALAVGVGLAVSGVVLALVVRRWLQTQKHELGVEATRILGVTRSRAALTRSLAIEVDQLMERCKSVDERFLGASLAIMLDEFQQAQGFDDRHRALAASVDFLDKLMKRLSPWYIRYDRLIAAVVALIGIVPGVIKIIQAVAAP